ncbi:MAG: hypothetical protein JO368_12945, partial [Acidimicrobiales bacterium]|nr:hypothetical protein [Acidimicrobiales bacterium]
GLTGLVVATGHYRNGVLLAPATAEEVVRILDAGAPREDAAGAGGDSPFTRFRPSRFATSGLDAPGSPVPASGAHRRAPVA